MNHPDELLAGFVDGSLPPGERTAVEAHLATCARCRDEVELAGAATRALASLPDEPVPSGVTQSVLAAAAAPARSGSPRWYRWAGAAAAAAVIALIAVALPNLGDESSSDMAAESPRAIESARTPPVLEVTRDNLDERKVADAARSWDLELTDAGAEGATAAPVAAAAITVARTAPDKTDSALACLQQAFGSEAADPVRLLQARFQDRSAYLGFYVDRPSGGSRPDSVTVLIAARRGCAILMRTTAALGS